MNETRLSDKDKCINLLNELLKLKHKENEHIEPTINVNHSESINNIDTLLEFLYKSKISQNVKDKLIKVKDILDK